MPATGTRTRRISSVAYAVDEMASDANTASAVGTCRAVVLLLGRGRQRPADEDPLDDRHVRLATDEEVAHRFLAVGRDEHEHLVALEQRRVAAGNDDVVLAQDGDHRGVAGKPEVDDLACRPPATSSASVTSTRRARPPSNDSRRTRLPTDTASSTSAVSRCGVETATSTPHISLNIHSFFGLLTRATTRGTANSCLASSEITRLSSSSPVTAATTSALSGVGPGQLASPRRRRPPATVTPGGSFERLGRPTRSASTSTMMTSWPALCELVGDERADVAAAGDDDPHQCALRRPGRRGGRRSRRCGRRAPPRRARRPPGPPASGGGTWATPRRVTATTRACAGDLELGDLLPGPRRRDRPLDQARPGRWGRSTRPRAGRAGSGAAPARWSTARWRWWRCRGARRWRPGGGRRCGRRPARCRRSHGPPGRSRMFELSPLVTAATASAFSMPASVRRSRSKPTPTTVRAGEARRQPGEGLLAAVDDGDGVAGSPPRPAARPEPTRPHPTTTTCTAPTSRATRRRSGAA